MGKHGPAHATAYLDEHHETVLNALEHATDLLRRQSWETTFWVRSHADARTLQRMLRRSVLEVTGRMDNPVLACVGLIHAREARDGDRAALEERWGVFVTVRPG